MKMMMMMKLSSMRGPPSAVNKKAGCKESKQVLEEEKTTESEGENTNSSSTSPGLGNQRDRCH